MGLISASRSFWVALDFPARLFPPPVGHTGEAGRETWMVPAVVLNTGREALMVAAGVLNTGGVGHESLMVIVLVLNTGAAGREALMVTAVVLVF